MKKLIMAVAIVCAAVAAQAAAFSWATSKSGKIYAAGSTTDLVAGTAYLFETTTMSQTALLNAFVDGSIDMSGASVSSATVASGAISTTEFAWGETGKTGNFYMAMIVDDNLYIGNTYEGLGQASATTKISISEKATSQLAAMDASNGYTKGGWYQSVPEPTSGLLLLLGMAGLALKRKQA